MVDDGQLPHLHTTLYPVDNHYDSYSTNNMTVISHDMISKFSWINDNFTTFEDFYSQYNDSHQHQYHQGTAVVPNVTAVAENTKSTLHPKEKSQNSKGIQRNRKNAKKKCNVIEKTQNNCDTGEERSFNDEVGAEGCTDGCVYMRAKRGQAIDSHSLAERVRRQKISDKMKLLQSLVPGCDNMASKILMLDNIIDYIHSLQNQVKSLMTQIALADPTIDLNNLAVESTVTQTEKLYATSQYQSVTLNGSSAPASALPSHWLALLEDREYTI